MAAFPQWKKNCSCVVFSLTFKNWFIGKHMNTSGWLRNVGMAAYQSTLLKTWLPIFTTKRKYIKKYFITDWLRAINYKIRPYLHRQLFCQWQSSFHVYCGVNLCHLILLQADISSNPHGAHWSPNYCLWLLGNLKTMYPYLNTNCYVSDYLSHILLVYLSYYSWDTDSSKSVNFLLDPLLYWYRYVIQDMFCFGISL